MRPRVSILESDRAVAESLAERIAAAVEQQPDVVLGLPTGRTPVLFYDALARLAGARRIDFSKVRTFNLDEFAGIPESHPGSYRQYMETHLFRRVNINPANVHFLNGVAEDPEAECARYEADIEAAGGIDIQILGIGVNGHIGFNEPGPELEARTHRVKLRPETRKSNAGLFGGDPNAVPTEALSMGMATILQARTIVLLATGRSKASCIERVVNGSITTELPASFLALHRQVEIVIDKEAAERIER